MQHSALLFSLAAPTTTTKTMKARHIKWIVRRRRVNFINGFNKYIPMQLHGICTTDYNNRILFRQSGYTYTHWHRQALVKLCKMWQRSKLYVAIDRVNKSKKNTRSNGKSHQLQIHSNKQLEILLFRPWKLIFDKYIEEYTGHFNILRSYEGLSWIIRLLMYQIKSSVAVVIYAKWPCSTRH